MRIKLFYSTILILFIVVGFSGCVQRNYYYPKTVKKKDNYTRDKVVKIKPQSSYKKKVVKSNSERLKKKSIKLMMQLEKNGINYRPWASHLNIDLILMKRMLKINKRDYLMHNRCNFDIIATKKKSFVSYSKNIAFINYKSTNKSILKFLKSKCRKSINKSAKKKVYIKRPSIQTKTNKGVVNGNSVVNVKYGELKSGPSNGYVTEIVK